MSKTWRVLGRSLVRRLRHWSTIGLTVSTFCLVFPAFGAFEYEFDGIVFDVQRVRRFQWIRFDSTASVSSQDTLYPTSLGDVTGFILGGSFAVKLRLGNNITEVQAPGNPFSFVKGTIVNQNITNSVYCTTNSVGVNASLRIFQPLQSVFSSVASLYRNGYRGSGITDDFSDGNIHCLNVNYPLLVSDVLASTNTVFRQLLLSSLSSIDSGVQSIALDVGGLQSSVDRLSDINISSLSNLESVAGISRSVLSNLLSVADSSRLSSPDDLRSALVAMRNSSAFNVNGVSLALDRAIFDLNPSNYDLSEEGGRQFYDFVVRSYQRGFNSLQDLIGFASLVDDVDPRYNGLSKIGELFVSSVVDKVDDVHNSVESVVDALIGDYPIATNNTRGAKSVSARTSIKSQLQDWRNEARRQLDDWKSDLKADLQAWKTSDEHGYLNIRESIDNNFTYTQRGLTNRFPFTAFVTNYVTQVITNAIEDSAGSIMSNATDNAKGIIDGAESHWNEFKRLATGTGDGLNVNIKFPLWETDQYHVNVRDDAVVQAIQDGIYIVSPDLTHISDNWDEFLSKYSPTNSFDWQPWFDKWDPFSDVVTNLYVDFNSSAPAVDIASDFLSRGFDFSQYERMPWFQRVEVLLAMIANVDSEAVEVADIEDDMEDQVTAFRNLSTNVVAVSGHVVGLFDYVKRFSTSLQSVFGDRAAPLTGDYVLLPAGHWIGDEPLTLRINPNIQNLCRLIMQCIWYLGFLVLLWVVVNWVWQKVVAVLRWLWSMFDV